MIRRYIAESAAIHVLVLGLLFLMQAPRRAPEPVFPLGNFTYLPGGGKGTGLQGGPPADRTGEIVSHPLDLNPPKKIGPEIIKEENAFPEEAKPKKEEQTPITRVGIKKETKPSDGAFTFDIGKGGLGGGNGNGIGTETGNGFEFSSYLIIMRKKIWSEWSQTAPYFAGKMCIVGLTVSKDGNVSGVALENSSGNVQYDSMALRAIRNASPLPPLPTGFLKSSQRFRIQFRLLE